jgi:hypothetical protein
MAGDPELLLLMILLLLLVLVLVLLRVSILYVHIFRMYVYKCVSMYYCTYVFRNIYVYMLFMYVQYTYMKCR